MTHRDLYIELSDPAGKQKPVVNYHRVWDATRFIAAQRDMHENAKEPGDRRNVAVVGREDYLKFRKGARQQ